MKYRVEIINKEETALFISPQINNCEKRFIKLFSRYDYKIKQSSFIEEITNDDSTLCLLFTRHWSDIKKIIHLSPKHSKLIIVFYTASPSIIDMCRNLRFPESKHIKIICIKNSDISDQETEQALWFGLSKSKENIITYNGIHLVNNTIHQQKIKKNKTIRIHTISKFRLLGLIVLFIFLFHSAIFICYSLSLIKIHNAYNTIQSKKIDNSKKYVQSAYTYSIYAKHLFSYIKPLYALFGAANTVDSFLAIPDLASKTLMGVFELEKHGRFIVDYITNSSSSVETNDEIIRLHLTKSLEKTDELLNYSSLLIQKLPPWGAFLKQTRKQLLLSEEALLKIKPLLANAQSIIGQKKDQKYVIFFLNNMELRPGGGFIGSYAIVVFNNFRLKELRIEDVYDADGQLKAHIEPPKPIKTYLRQPHWFLRDSNFSPDFLVNTQKAFEFLEKEMGYKNFEGSIGITTTAIQYILDAIGQIYLPDWQEYITKDNFYIKTQIHAEKDFFPGSIQKKSFLNSLTRVLIQKIPDASYQKIALALKRSLDEKHIVLYSVHDNVQKMFEQSGWAGRYVNPSCAHLENNCVLDFVFPYDANLGLNKSNFYVKRQYEFTTTFDQTGDIIHRLKTNFVNDSPLNAFPGGVYGNYFQILIPKNSEKISVTINGTHYPHVDIEDVQNAKKIGLFIEVPPRSSKIIQLDYQLNSQIKKGKTVYQLIVQKQIGSMNNDFNLHIYTSPQTHIINQNFSSLAKNGYLVYNTSLSNDRIFFIEIATE